MKPPNSGTNYATYVDSTKKCGCPTGQTWADANGCTGTITCPGTGEIWVSAEGKCGCDATLGVTWNTDGSGVSSCGCAGGMESSDITTVACACDATKNWAWNWTSVVAGTTTPNPSC